jgi:sugar lactone lactonase YvrE
MHPEMGFEGPAAGPVAHEPLERCRPEYPIALATDKEDRAYVADPANKRVIQYDPSGKVLEEIPLREFLELKYGNSTMPMALDDAGNLFVTDGFAEKLVRIAR